MSLGRKLLPIAGPLVIAVVLAMASAFGIDETEKPEGRAPVYSEHPPGPARPEPTPPAAAQPTEPPVDRPRCIASMTVGELARQLMTMRQAVAIAELYREEAPPEVALAYLEGLADVSTKLLPGVARSRLLVIAADGLVRLGRAQQARAALAASRELPPPLPGDFDFERSDWRGEAAQVAARLDDHAFAKRLVGDDPDAQAALAQHYAEAGDSARARELLGAIAPNDSGLGGSFARASALAGVGEKKAALALADGAGRHAELVRLAIARTLIRQGHHEDAVAVLLAMVEGMPESLEWWDRLGAMVPIAVELDEAGRRDAALELLERTRKELQGKGDAFRALGIWAGLIDAEHRLGKTEQAWADVEAFGKMSLADMNAAPMTRVLLLVRENRLADALGVIHATAAITYPLAYAYIHTHMRGPDAALEHELDGGLRMFCK